MATFSLGEGEWTFGGGINIATLRIIDKIIKHQPEVVHCRQCKMRAKNNQPASASSSAGVAVLATLPAEHQTCGLAQVQQHCINKTDGSTTYQVVVAALPLH